MVTANEITKKIVAIVRFGPAGAETDGIRPGEYFQVTVDPDHFSSSKEYIRFGMNDGDEITGWQKAKMITVVDVLAEWPEDGSRVQIPWHTSGAVTQT